MPKIQLNDEEIPAAALTRYMETEMELANAAQATKNKKKDENLIDKLHDMDDVLRRYESKTP
jgi:hypothetical protein